MKQTVFIFGFLLTLSLSLKSQEYVPFPMENANWNVYYVGTCEERTPDTILLKYTIRGDTTINKNLYKKLCLESENASTHKVRGIGGLREEDKKIYYAGKTILGVGSNQEYLLYDFTKDVKDTIRHDVQGNFYSVILATDSVLIDGHYRKRYKVDNHWFYQNPDYIIEGIGSVKNGLLGHISDITTCGTHYWEHVCFKENEVVKYLNPSFTDCSSYNLFNKVEREKYEKSINIYPNPFSNEIRINNKFKNQNLIFKLIDINGKIFIKRMLDSSTLTLDLKISPGFYTAFIVDKNDKVLYSTKMIRK